MTKQEIGGKENKEFYEDARKVAESCSKERLVELYLAEVQTCCEVEEENQQLKQQLHELPKKIIRDVVDELGDCGKIYLENEPYIKICIVKSILQAILKKYGDKNESNND